MLDILLIINLVMMVQRLAIRGKTIEQLSPVQVDRINRGYMGYQNSRAWHKRPMPLEEYVVMYARSWVKHMILAIICLVIIVPLYVLVFIWLMAV